MPRDGSGIYSRPAGIDAVTDTTIESAKYNLNVQDVEADLNVPRPIAAGGTGASNAVDAMANLGGEIAYQQVTNYDTFAFKAGSFFSTPAATSAPVADWCEGICYMSSPGATDFFIEARALNSGINYVRKKLSGVWQAWVQDLQAAFDADTALGAAKVAKAGDTMTGQLNLHYANPVLVLDDTGVGQANHIFGNTAGSQRWEIVLGDGSAESGSNAGSNFSLARYSDTSAFLGNALSILRNDGRIFGNGYVPSSANELTNKAYVDAQITANDVSDKAYVDAQIATLNTGVNAKVAKAGDIMTGNLTIVRTSAWTTLQLNSDVGQATQFLGVRTGSGARWQFDLGDATAEGGGNTGCNIGIHRYDNSGAYAGQAVYISRADGSVGIGTSGPTQKLDVNGGFTCAAKAFLGTGTAGRAGSSGAFDGNAHNFYWTGTVNQMWIDATNMGTVNVTCDYRIKKNVVPLPSTWEQVKALKPISYTQAEFTPPANKVFYAKEAAALREADPKATVPVYPPTFIADDIERWGFIAHELQETLLPTAATGTKDAPAEIQSPNLLAIVAALTKALQEAMARIEALEAI